MPSNLTPLRVATPPDLAPQAASPHDCPDTCALLTTGENAVATRVQGNPGHPQTGGALCNKVSRHTKRTYHAERLLQPRKRAGAKGSGRFEPVSWDTALSEIAERLKAIAARDPEAVRSYSYCSTLGQVQGQAMAGRFFNRLGASLLDRTICAAAGAEGLTQTLGGKVGMRVDFLAKSKLIIIWGRHSIGSYRVRAEVSLRARPGVVNGLGIWWRKLGLGGTNVNEPTSQHLTDPGRGPVFHDCLVQVQAA